MTQCRNQPSATECVCCTQKIDITKTKTMATTNIIARETALMAAAEKGELERVTQLLASNTDVDAENAMGNTALMYAANAGKLEVMKSLLAAGAKANHQAMDGWSALMYAARDGHTGCAELLIATDAILDRQAKDGQNALMCASKNGKTDVVKKLLAAGARVNCQDELGWTALFYALARTERAVVEQLLAAGASVNHQNKEGKTALLFAFEKQNEHCALILLATKDVSLDCQDNAGCTALMHAAATNSIRGTEALIAAGAAKDIQDAKGYSAVMHTVESHSMCSLGVLLDAGVDITLRNKEGNTARKVAENLYGSSPTAVELFKKAEAAVDAKSMTLSRCPPPKVPAVERCAAVCWPEAVVKKELWVNRQDKCGKTSLMYAAEQGDTTTAAQLLATPDVDVDLQAVNGWTALMYAADAGRGDVVTQLRAAGADVNVKEQSRMTALILAADKGHMAVVELLLRFIQSIDVNAGAKEGKTALMCAAAHGHTTIVELLLCVPDIDVNAVNWTKKTALMWAAMCGHSAAVALLLAAEDVDVHVEDQWGDTALMIAASFGQGDVVALLLAREDVDVNRANKFGITALMKAAIENQFEVAKQLLAAGADVDLSDEDGSTAYSHAVTEGHTSIAELLKEGTKRKRSPSPCVLPPLPQPSPCSLAEKCVVICKLLQSLRPQTADSQITVIVQRFITDTLTDNKEEAYQKIEQLNEIIQHLQVRDWQHNTCAKKLVEQLLTVCSQLLYPATTTTTTTTTGNKEPSPESETEKAQPKLVDPEANQRARVRLLHNPSANAVGIAPTLFPCTPLPPSPVYVPTIPTYSPVRVPNIVLTPLTLTLLRTKTLVEIQDIHARAPIYVERHDNPSDCITYCVTRGRLELLKFIYANIPKTHKYMQNERDGTCYADVLLRKAKEARQWHVKHWIEERVLGWSTGDCYGSILYKEGIRYGKSDVPYAMNLYKAWKDADQKVHTDNPLIWYVHLPLSVLKERHPRTEREHKPPSRHLHEYTVFYCYATGRLRLLRWFQSWYPYATIPAHEVIGIAVANEHWHMLTDALLDCAGIEKKCISKQDVLMKLHLKGAYFFEKENVPELYESWRDPDFVAPVESTPAQKLLYKLTQPLKDILELFKTLKAPICDPKYVEIVVFHAAVLGKYDMLDALIEHNILSEAAVKHAVRENAEFCTLSASKLITKTYGPIRPGLVYRFWLHKPDTPACVTLSEPLKNEEEEEESSGRHIPLISSSIAQMKRKRFLEFTLAEWIAMVKKTSIQWHTDLVLYMILECVQKGYLNKIHWLFLIIGTDVKAFVDEHKDELTRLVTKHSQWHIAYWFKLQGNKLPVEVPLLKLLPYLIQFNHPEKPALWLDLNIGKACQRDKDKDPESMLKDAGLEGAWDQIEQKLTAPLPLKLK